jgi:PhnB protein
MMLEVSPALSFNGNCEAAFEHYRSVFGGEYHFIYRYRDVPFADVPDEYAEKILHVSLPLMRNVNLMGSDAIDESVHEHSTGSVMVGLRLNDEKEAFRLFEALSEGGKVVTPLGKTFYADWFGSVIDRFGIGWSFNCNIGREAEV